MVHGFARPLLALGMLAIAVAAHADPRFDSRPPPDMTPGDALVARVEALFDAFPVADRYDGPLHDPDPAGFPDVSYAEHYLDAARDGGIAYAGRYMVAMVGCGTGCQALFFFDAETGALLTGPVASYGARWRADSRLLIVNDPYELGTLTPLDGPAYNVPRCFVLGDGAFAPVACGR